MDYLTDIDEPVEELLEDETRRRRRVAGWLFGTWAGRGLMTILALTFIAFAGVAVTGALLTDQATMATVTTVGGTLDIVANGNVSDTAVAYNGVGATITTNVSNMKPGDTAFGDVTIANTGTLPLTMTVTQTGSDTHAADPTQHCFSYYFRQIAAPTGATKDPAFPVNITNMGTDQTTDAGTRLFETGVVAGTMYDVTATDTTWETDDSKTYRLHVRMLSACTQGGDSGASTGTPSGATGTLNFTFNAIQA